MPQKMFGRENFGAIAGALAGPTLMAQAAGPLVVAALIEADISPTTVLAALLAVSLFSAYFYLMAVRRQTIHGQSMIASTGIDTSET